MINNVRPTSRNLEILELARKACEANAIAFSVNDANQSLADVGNTTSDVEDRQLLDAVGQRVGIRFREVQGKFHELVLAATEASPVIVPRNEEVDRGHDKGNYFLIVRKKSFRRFVIILDGHEKIVSTRWLQNNVAYHEKGDIHWYLAQPVFAAEAASAYNYPTGTQAKPLSPVKRLLAFLRPEARDMRVIFIFAVVVGVGALILGWGKLRGRELGFIAGGWRIGLIGTVVFWLTMNLLYLLQVWQSGAEVKWNSQFVNWRWMQLLIDLLVTQVIGNALLEEIVFRGYFFQQLEARLVDDQATGSRMRRWTGAFGGGRH